MQSNGLYQPHQGFKGFFRTLFPEIHFTVETYLEGHIEREVFRRRDKADATQVEALYLPENGSYSQLIQIKIKHPKSPALNRLQNKYLVSPINFGTGTFTAENTHSIEAQFQLLFAKGWAERCYHCRGKHLYSMIQWVDGQKWYYHLEKQKLRVTPSIFDWIQPYKYRFWGCKTDLRHIQPMALNHQSSWVRGANR